MAEIRLSDKPFFNSDLRKLRRKSARKDANRHKTERFWKNSVKFLIFI